MKEQTSPPAYSLTHCRWSKPVQEALPAHGHPAWALELAGTSTAWSSSAHLGHKNKKLL